MGVYVPNIKKPKHCTECYFVCRDQCELQDNSYDYDTFKEQKKHCPLIEIDLVRCGECKYFNLNEWDETICGVPIIVAHEICHKWGDGCKTNIYGFCFMGERRADDVRHNEQQDF